MTYLYGELPKEQIHKYKQNLHGMIHWLLIYKQYEEKYKYVDLDKYFIYVLSQLNGLNELLEYPVEMIMLLNTIQSAKTEGLKTDCDFKLYRKLILDAHSLIDKIKEE